MPLQVVCNYCFSSSAKELAHQFGTLTDVEQPRKAPYRSRATRTERKGKFFCTKETTCIWEGLLGRTMCWGTGREKKEDEKLVGEEKIIFWLYFNFFFSLLAFLF